MQMKQRGFSRGGKSRNIASRTLLGTWVLHLAITPSNRHPPCYLQTVTAKNQLYYGDNYEVLQRYIKDESVDLIYLDPPFNSRQDYNVLFAEKDGSHSSSQIHAFEDTWEWNIDAQRSLELIIERGGRVADAMRAFHTFRQSRSLATLRNRDL